MTRLVWNADGARFFEAGVDHGVLYVDGLGVPWNGLISVNESTDGGDITARYIDGVKYKDVRAAEEFRAEIVAYTYPDEFLACEGVTPVRFGLFASQQRKKSFGLCYRTGVGNDADGLNHAYKLHLIYNASTAPSERNFNTVGEEVEPFNFTWNISAVPTIFAGLKPTPNFIIDSRDVPPDLMVDILAVLYGTDTTPARLPSVGELLSIFNNYQAVGFDAGHLTEEYFATFDAGRVGEPYTSTIDGGEL